MRTIAIPLLDVRPATEYRGARLVWCCPLCDAICVEYPDDARMASLWCAPRDCGDRDAHCGKEFILNPPRRLCDCIGLSAIGAAGAVETW